MSEVETRIALEMRADGRRLVGYAALFNSPTEIMDFKETVAPGAFAPSLRSNEDIVALVDHNREKILGRTRNQTLRLAEDQKGLAFEIDVPLTQLGADTLALAERGDLGGMSFSFIVPKGGDSWEGRNRVLRNIKLIEISVVSTFPAYKGTSVQARSKQAGFNNPVLPLSLAQRYLERFTK